MKDLYDIGEEMPIGAVPPKMHAMTLRKERYGQPRDAFQPEIVSVPEIGPNEILVRVMAAGINPNNVWGAFGKPADLIKDHALIGDKTGFHIGGSDASGIVYAVGGDVTNVKVGDKVVIHCGSWDPEDPTLKTARFGNPMFAKSYKIWGHATNWGSFAQFTKVWSHQCLPKAPHLTWEEAAASTLVGSTAYHMLTCWPPNVVQPDDIVLIWGGAGGLGSAAIQMVKLFGSIPVAVVSSEERGEYCKGLGAVGYINRKQFSHWGRMPDYPSIEEPGYEEKMAKYTEQLLGIREFARVFWKVVGPPRRNPAIVFEHPGRDTVPTSIYLADDGGMVVICAGTSGFNADVNLLYLWNKQIRFQGSHFANGEQARDYNDLVIGGDINPCLTKVWSFGEIGRAHQALYEGSSFGNTVALIGTKEPGLGRD